jgi:hypothetical protein
MDGIGAFKLGKPRQTEEMEIVEMSAKLCGVIFRKAELENSFEQVYTRVFERMVTTEVMGSETFLEILGEVGG